jgi:hypothetical protein
MPSSPIRLGGPNQAPRRNPQQWLSEIAIPPM